MTELPLQESINLIKPEQQATKQQQQIRRKIQDTISISPWNNQSSSTVEEEYVFFSFYLLELLYIIVDIPHPSHLRVFVPILPIEPAIKETPVPDHKKNPCNKNIVLMQMGPE